MNVAAENRTVLMPIGIAALAVVLTTLIGASILAVAVADDTNAGGAIWFYPLLAIVPIATSLILSGGTVFAGSGLIRGWRRSPLGTGFGLVLIFLVFALGFWLLAGNWLFATVIVALPEVNREAEEIFYRSWFEIETRIVSGAAFVAIALSAVVLRPTTKYWIPITCIAIVLAGWELRFLVSTQV